MRHLLCAAAVLLGLTAAAAAQIDQAPKVTPRLVAEDSAVAPGGHVAIALEEKIHDGWHTYWINPGDAGAPTTIDWTLPAGWKAGAIQWPTPKRLPVLWAKLAVFTAVGAVTMLASSFAAFLIGQALLAPTALAERLRKITELFPPNPGFEFAIYYKRRN